MGVRFTMTGQANHRRQYFQAGDTGFGSTLEPRVISWPGAAHRCATAAYDIPAGNSYGPIIDATGAGDLSAVPGADHPWANFLY